MTGKSVDRVMGRDSLSSHLEEQIVTGRLGEGHRLPSERSLSGEYDLSRPVIREALRELTLRGLVEVVPGRGAYVRRARAEDATGPLEAFYRRRQVTPRDLIEARKTIETEAAALAAVRSELGDLESMEWALTRFEQPGVGLIEKARYDITFHVSIVRAAHNPVIETMYGSIRSMVVELMLRSLGDPTVSRAGLPYHREIYEAIRGGDQERAHRQMAGHLTLAEQLYGDDFDQSLHFVTRRELDRLLGPGVSLDALLAATAPEDQEEGDEGQGSR